MFSKDLKTALHFACANNHVEIAGFLMSKGADNDLKDKVNIG